MISAAATGLAVCGILFSSGQARAAVVAAWTFDNDFTADVGGAAFDLTAVNGATAGAPGGVFGNAASFSRASSQYAFTAGNDLTVGSDFSYSAWYSSTVTDVGGGRYFVLETMLTDAPTGGGSAWTASLGLRRVSGANVMQVYTHPSQLIFNIAGGNATDGGGLPMWHNVVITYDAGSGEFNSYLDGTLFGTLTSAAARTAVEGLVIGGHRAGTGRNFDGLIDDVAFYDNVLSQSDITALQSASAIPEPTIPALLGLMCTGLFLRRRRG
jgi:hypothetical protein